LPQQRRGTITVVGGGVIESFSPYGPGISWTDGTPTGSVSQTLTGVYVAGANKGIQFTVPADQATRTLYVHVEAWRAQGKFEATLSDGSAAAFVETSLNNTSGGSLTGIYVVQYNAASAGQTLTVQWTSTATHESGGNVSLRGVALTTGQGGGGGSPGATYQNLTYSFDAAGNLEALTDPLHGNQTLSYDALDRLTQATGPYGTSGATASITYEYDAIGNLIKNTQLSSTAYTYPNSGSSSVRPHAVSTAGGHTYSYDNNGNVTSGAGRTYTWNPENKPLTITQGGTTTTFVYDGDGGRVKKVVGSTTTRYLSKLYECETTGAGTTCTRYIWAGNTRIATVDGTTGDIRYWHPDHLGSSTVITDSTGTQVQAVAYYPYGVIRMNESPSQPPVDVPYKFTGQELDASTGLYDYGARLYDTVLGRFISADTIVPNPQDPQDLNRYTYAGNNPFTYTDPTGYFKINIGKFFQRAFGDVGTAVVGVVTQLSGPLLMPVCGPFCAIIAGGGILSQSKSGRYVLAAEIIGATTIGAAMVPTATPLVASMWGSWGLGGIGAYSASQAGGDISKGLLVGVLGGAATGALGGWLWPAIPSVGAPSLSWGSAKGVALFLGQKALIGAGIGTVAGGVTGYAGGTGDWARVSHGLIHGAAFGALTGAALGGIDVAGGIGF